jgi:hypothetical protein
MCFDSSGKRFGVTLDLSEENFDIILYNGSREFSDNSFDHFRMLFYGIHEIRKD